MTPAEFVAARLDEHEAQAHLSVAQNATNPELRIPAGWIEGVAARMLRMVEAQRKILALHEVLVRGSAGDLCFACDESHSYPCPTVRALTQQWRDHPDWDEAWG